jgi:ceramide glucosyltransferase
MLIVKIAGAVLAAGGIAYLLLALFHVARHRPAAPQAGLQPPVSVMVPAHGVPPRLEECLRSICDQDYPAFQVVFGLHAPDDAARPVIERVMAAFPQLDVALVIDDRRIGANPKNANLANMLPACKHDVLVMVDSDVRVERDFLAAIVEPLADPAVGGATCLYKAAPEPGLSSALGALYINDWFIPSVLVDLARREMDVCYGAAIAVSRHALDTIGGFQAMADAVAQDFVFGHELHRHGFAVRLAAPVVETVVAEPGVGSLLRHELRWNRAVRAVRPFDHALSLFMSPLAPVALLLLAGWQMDYALPVVLLHVLLRIALHHLLRSRLRLPRAEPWLVPLREILNVAVWGAAFFGRTVRWGGSVLVTGEGLTMRAAEADSPRSNVITTKNTRSLTG